MLFNDPRSIERDNENALRKYPFSDAAACSGKWGVIPPGAVVDLRLYLPGAKPSAVWLSRVTDDGRLEFSSAGKVVATTVGPVQPNSVVRVETPPEWGGAHAGVAVFGDEAGVSGLTALCGKSFKEAETMLCPAAVSWTGLPGVLGFRLDDGSVVSGDVEFVGENGCEVSVAADGGVPRLRFSAVGARAVETGDLFVTSVTVESDNSNFTVARSWPRVVDVYASGANMLRDDGEPVDQDDVCSEVKVRRGVNPGWTHAAACTDKCGSANAGTCTLTFSPATGDGRSSVNPLLGAPIGSVVPPVRGGSRFAGYYAGSARYYTAQGKGLVTVNTPGTIPLTARWVPAESRVVVDVGGYGTLHLAAPNTTTYNNPVTISGNPAPAPVVKALSRDALAAGKTEALAESLMQPFVPSGEVRIGVRGLMKAVDL